MLVGMDKFREHFATHEGKYAIIGGAACDQLLSEAGREFRVTKDIDMVLCVEIVDAGFADAFKSFLEAGGYKAWQRSSGKTQFYRFVDPTDRTYPYMIELLSRGDAGGLSSFGKYKRISVEDSIVSLSAIVLNETYYKELQSGKRDIEGVSFVSEDLLIPFKALAHLNLAGERKSGAGIGRDQVNKHRSDIFRLMQLIPEGAVFDYPESIKDDLRRFIAAVKSDGNFEPRSIGLTAALDESLAALEKAYAL